MAVQLPRQGDLIVLSFDPQAGHEQRGRRPALVVSKDLFNRHTGLCLACPITNTRREHPFHVALPSEGAVTGSIMVEQVKSVDFRTRKARQIGTVAPEILDEVLAILDACVY